DAAVRPHGSRRVGGDRRRLDQAIWLYALPARPWGGWPLRADRPLLSDVEGARVWPDHALYRAGGRDQYADALLRARSGDPGAQHTSSELERRAGATARRGLQTRCLRLSRVA